MFFYPFTHKSFFCILQKLIYLNDDTQYRQCRLFLPVPITTDYFNNWPDYAFGHYIVTALVHGMHKV